MSSVSLGYVQLSFFSGQNQQPGYDMCVQLLIRSVLQLKIPIFTDAHSALAFDNVMCVVNLLRLLRYVRVQPWCPNTAPARVIAWTRYDSSTPLRLQVLQPYTSRVPQRPLSSPHDGHASTNLLQLVTFGLHIAFPKAQGSSRDNLAESFCWQGPLGVPLICTRLIFGDLEIQISTHYHPYLQLGDIERWNTTEI